MIEDTRGYREMMRMTHDGFLELLRLMEPDITPCPLWECQVLFAFPLLSFTTQRFFGNFGNIFNNVHQSFFFVHQF